MREPEHWDKRKVVTPTSFSLNLKQSSRFLGDQLAVGSIMEKDLIFFNSRDALLRIGIDKIVYFEADGNYTDIIMVNKLRASVCMNLGEMERALADQIGDKAKRFMRIGKRFIINMEYVYQINVLKQQLVLSDYDHFAFQVSVSKDALKKMKDLMLITKV